MNTHTQHEASAVITLLRCADGLASSYSIPTDMDAARLALLISAVEVEMLTHGLDPAKCQFFTTKEKE